MSPSRRGVLCLLAAMAAGLAFAEGSLVIWPSKTGLKPASTGHARLAVGKDGAVDVQVPSGEPWSGVVFTLPEPLDLCKWRGLSVTVLNKTARPLVIECHAKSAARAKNFPSEVELPAFGEGEIRLRPSNMTLPAGVEIPGLRGYDTEGCTPSGFDVHNVSSFTIFYRSKGQPPAAFEVKRIEASGDLSMPASLTAENFFPFCDRYGQFKHLEWPGKVHSDEDLAAIREKEERWLAKHDVSPISGADRFGGWAKGPQLKATGFFRTEKVDGRWWFVDPDGRLFFSQGIDGVRANDVAGVTGREKFFEWMPAEDDETFASCWLTINEGSSVGFYKDRFPYKAFSFATANQIRKYGKDWHSRTFADLSHRRLRAWGINTVGNWSDDVVKRAGRTPYTDTFRTEDRRPLVNRFPDPFSPEFAATLAARAAQCAKASGEDPWCLGWFVDNELNWGRGDDALAKAAQKAADDQPAKVEFLRWLRARHGESATVDSATSEDLVAFHRIIAEKYFSSVRDAIKRVAPNRLYLGCRFAAGSAETWRVAARYCDVVSVNTYRMTPSHGFPPDCEDKPLMIGEFHFGALDRGMLHTGLVPAISQEERAERYKAYVRAGLADRHIIGTHWFIWRDQPLAGRGDGEGFQIGFLDVADRPYPKMVDAAIELAHELYR